MVIRQAMSSDWPWQQCRVESTANVRLNFFASHHTREDGEGGVSVAWLSDLIDSFWCLFSPSNCQSMTKLNQFFTSDSKYLYPIEDIPAKNAGLDRLPSIPQSWVTKRLFSMFYNTNKYLKRQRDERPTERNNWGYSKPERCGFIDSSFYMSTYQEKYSYVKSIVQSVLRQNKLYSYHCKPKAFTEFKNICNASSIQSFLLNHENKKYMEVEDRKHRECILYGTHFIAYIEQWYRGASTFCNSW